MKRLFFLLLSLLCCVEIFSQSDSTCILDDSMHCTPLEFIMMINGKLPLNTHTTIKFDDTVYGDSIEYWWRENFKSYSVPKDKVMQLCELIPDTANVYLEYCFYEPIGYNQNRLHKYLDTLDWETVKGIGIVIISDIDIKKGIYYIHYELQPPWKRLIMYKKEYGNFERFMQKAFKGIYPATYSIPDCKKRRGHFVPKKHGKGKSRPRW